MRPRALKSVKWMGRRIHGIPIWLLVGAFSLACGSDDAEILTVAVERGPLEASVSATGTLNPVHMVEVGTQTSGRIETIDVDYNSPVTKGQRVAKIDPANARIRVQKARAALHSADAALGRAEADLLLKTDQLERQRTLHAEALASEERFDTARTEHAQASAERAIRAAAVEQARAELDDATVNLGYTDILSPVDGIVISKNVNVGQTVAASFQTPTLFLIAQDLHEMQVNADVSESDIGRIVEGQAARFRVDAFPDRVFEGVVRQVRNSPRSVQNVVTYDVVIDVDNRDLALRPGMTATISLVTGTRDDVLKVPLRALRFRPEGRGENEKTAMPVTDSGRPQARLWIQNGEGVPKPVWVEMGLRNDEQVEVIGDGVAEGDPVAVGYRRGS